MKENINNTTITIETATSNDVDDLFYIMKTTHDLLADPGWFIIDDKPFIEHIMAEEGIIFKAMQNGQIAGYLMLYYPNAHESNLATALNLPKDLYSTVVHIESTAVLPNFRGQRILSQLLDYTHTYLKSLPTYQYAMATVHPDNKSSLQSFLRSGYEIIKTTKKYGGLPRHILSRSLK